MKEDNTHNAGERMPQHLTSVISSTEIVWYAIDHTAWTDRATTYRRR